MTAGDNCFCQAKEPSLVSLDSRQLEAEHIHFPPKLGFLVESKIALSPHFSFQVLVSLASESSPTNMNYPSSIPPPLPPRRPPLPPRRPPTSNENRPREVQGSGFDYATVPLARRERRPGAPLFTRMLRLAPGNKGDLLRGSIELVNVRCPRQMYEALSYRWAENRDGSLECGGRPLQIARNLENALEHLRDPDSPRWIWNDFLCIDQDNEEEKLDQIGIMRWIYKCSQRVVVWLGLGSRAAYDAIELVEEIAQERDRFAAGQPRVVMAPLTEFLVGVLSGSSPLSTTEPGLLDRLLGRAIDIRHLLESEWFSRVWCIQEVVVATSCVILCGERQTDFYNFISVAPIVANTMAVSFPGQFPSLPRRFSFWAAVYEWRRGTLSIPHVEGALSNLLVLLEAGRDFGAGFSQDKVIAFLGISNEGVQAEAVGELGFSRFYSTIPDARIVCPPGSVTHQDSVRVSRELCGNPAWDPATLKGCTGETVFRKFTILLLYRQGGQLDVLSHVQWKEGPLGIGRPSWVPRWDQPRQVQMPFAQGHSMDLFWAHGGWYPPAYARPPWGFANIPDTISLQLPGYRLGIVTRCADPIAVEGDDLIPVAHLWEQIFGASIHWMPIPRYRNGLRADTAFLATLIAGLYASYRTFQLATGRGGPLGVENNFAALVAELGPAIPAAAASMAAWRLQNIRHPPGALYEVLVAEASGGNAKLFEEAAKETTFGRKVFLTNSGYLGLGPRAMQTGDEVVVLAGGRLPFVLRGRMGYEWHLVGETYIHDDAVMWGNMTQAVISGTLFPSPLIETFHIV